MHTQTLSKTLKLEEGWRDNGYKGYSDYASSASRVAKAIELLLLSTEVEVVSLTQEISIVLKEKNKTVSNNLTSDFWVSVATGTYKDDE